MLSTNSWITTLLIIEKGTGFNVNIRAGMGASSNNVSDYGVPTPATDCRKYKQNALKVVYFAQMFLFLLVVFK